jgi:hypothetical protein
LIVLTETAAVPPGTLAFLPVDADGHDVVELVSDELLVLLAPKMYRTCRVLPVGTTVTVYEAASKVWRPAKGRQLGIPGLTDVRAGELARGADRVGDPAGADTQVFLPGTKPPT